MRVAVIGAGTWGRNIITNIQELDALAAVVDFAPDVREKVSTDFPDVPVHADCTAVLESDIPAVAIATPAGTHFDIAREALRAGKDVFVEKPMALSSVEATSLVDMAESDGRILMVGHLLIYQPAVQWIRDYLSRGELGVLHSLHQLRLNAGQARSVENALWSLGVHDIAVLLYLVDMEPVSVQATGHRILQDDIEDDVHLHMYFSGSVQAHLHVSWLWPERRRRLVVIGSKAILAYDEVHQTVTLHRKRIGPDLKIRDEGDEVVFQGSGEPLKLEMRSFLEAIETRTPPLSDGHNGVKVVRVLEEASTNMKGIVA